jgi:hypothetical protein
VCSASECCWCSWVSPQLDKAAADAAEYKAGFDKYAADAAELKAGYDKLSADNAEQQAQLDKAEADAAEFKAGYDKLLVDTSEQKAQVCAYRGALTAYGVCVHALCYLLASWRNVELLAFLAMLKFMLRVAGITKPLTATCSVPLCCLLAALPAAGQGSCRCC